ncbi:hypothetical protein SEA_KEANU_80 [Streptomyces phage Keanu]|nr:hypothetical protein SEA_KEANU_80 [Streptomyces phage Keanu]
MELTEAQRDDFNNRATEALELLAQDPAGYFERANITGVQSNRDDPIVRALTQSVPPPEGFRWLSNKDHVRLQFTAERDSQLIVFTPDPLREFQEKFDRGLYPHLVDGEVYRA